MCEKCSPEEMQSLHDETVQAMLTIVSALNGPMDQIAHQEDNDPTGQMEQMRQRVIAAINQTLPNTVMASRVAVLLDAVGRVVVNHGMQLMRAEQPMLDALRMDLPDEDDPYGDVIG